MRLAADQQVISLIIPDDNACILTASEHGYGKRSAVNDFRLTRRGGQGVIAMQCNERNCPMIGAVQVSGGDEIMLISDHGTLVRTRVEEISVMSRNTQGVRLIRLSAGERLVGVERVDEPEEDELVLADDDIQEPEENL